MGRVWVLGGPDECVSALTTRPSEERTETEAQLSLLPPPLAPVCRTLNLQDQDLIALVNQEPLISVGVSGQRVSRLTPLGSVS